MPPHAAHPAVTMPPVPFQPNVHLYFAQREVCQMMQTGQHVEAQIQNLKKRGHIMSS